MRHFDRNTRIAIATLYIRVRDARRRVDNMRGTMPPEDYSYQKALTEYITSQNCLQAVVEALTITQPPHTQTPQAFIKIVGALGRFRRPLKKAA